MPQSRDTSRSAALPHHWTGSSWVATAMVRNQRAIEASLGTEAVRRLLDELAERLRLDAGATQTQLLADGVSGALPSACGDAHDAESAVRLALTPPVTVGNRRIEPDLDIWVHRA